MDKCEEKLKELAITFHGIVECPVCLGIIDLNSKLCKNGHGVCRLCASKIEKCPTCQQEFASELRQNTLLGKLLEHLPKMCPYNDKGCDTVVFDQEHQSYCEYRPTKCLKRCCDWKGCVKELLDHVRNCSKGSDKSVVSLNLEVPQSNNTTVARAIRPFFTPIICENQVFWKYFEWDEETKCIYHKLFYLPTSKQSCNYYLVVSFKKGDVKFELSCKATAYKNEKSERSLKVGLIIPNSEMKRFLNPGSDNKYEYTFKLVKEEIL